MSHNQDKEEILQEEREAQAQEEAENYVEQEEIIENQETELAEDAGQIAKLKDALTRTQADYENFQKRTERDKTDMIFFLKKDILKKILPRIDDLERIIVNTPVAEQTGPLFEGISATLKSLLKDLKSLGVESFHSKGNTVNPELHEVMTQIPGEEGKIIDEFETGYMLGDKVLRVAKVVVGNGE